MFGVLQGESMKHRAIKDLIQLADNEMFQEISKGL